MLNVNLSTKTVIKEGLKRRRIAFGVDKDIKFLKCMLTYYPNTKTQVISIITHAVL